VSKGRTTTVNGIPVIELRDSGSVLYAATTWGAVSDAPGTRPAETR
jgi:hypothetical protein